MPVKESRGEYMLSRHSATKEEGLTQVGRGLGRVGWAFSRRADRFATWTAHSRNPSTPCRGASHAWHPICFEHQRFFRNFTNLSFGAHMSATVDLICLSHLRWNFVYQRPNHLMSRCARKRRVFFFEEPINDVDCPSLEIS